MTRFLSLLAAVLALTTPIAVPAQGRPTVNQPSLKSESPQTKSAQGDCVREANRRGFTVLDTRNFQQSREGWSIDLRVRDMRGRTSEGSCFVEARTGDVNLYGFGWGYDDSGDDQMEFNCASVESRYRECQLPVNGRAQLIKQKSDSPCVEGQTWGQRGDRVWVDRGCRGKFEVRRGGWGGGGGGSNDLVECISENGRYRECSLGGSGYFARLQREYSNGRCREDDTWGTRNGVVWVKDNCRAQFRRQRGNAGGGSTGGNGPVFECRSSNGRYEECSIGRGYTGRLVRDYSGRCRAGSTWGTRDGVVWVNGNCAGQFERIRGGSTIGGGYGDHDSDDNDQGGSGSKAGLAALDACTREAQRRGYGIEKMGTASQGAGVYRIPMKLDQPNGGGSRSGTCSYYTGSREARIEF